MEASGPFFLFVRLILGRLFVIQADARALGSESESERGGAYVHYLLSGCGGELQVGYEGFQVRGLSLGIRPINSVDSLEIYIRVASKQMGLDHKVVKIHGNKLSVI